MDMDYGFWVEAHSGIRWLIVLAGLIALGRVIYGWTQNKLYGKLDQRLFAVLNGLLGLQFVLGLVLIVWRGVAMGWGTLINPLVHLVIMLAAIGIVGATGSRMKRTDTSQAAFRIGTVGLLVAAVLVFAGVVVVNGWS